MKKVMFLMTVAMLAASAMATPTAVVTDAPGANYGSGGAFQATVDGYGTFVTFCVETGRYFTPGETYYFTIDDAVKDGAGSNSFSDDTKMLYASFLNAGSPEASGADYQHAIWTAEGFETGYDYSSLITDISGWQNVKALNLWLNADGTGDVQSHLIRVPVPGAILLGGIGVSIVGWLKRRRSL